MAAGRRRARAAEPRHRSVGALHVAAQAVRVSRRGTAHRRVATAGAGRGSARRGERVARRAGSARGRWRAAIARVIGDRALAVRLARRAFETAAEFTWAKRAERLESRARGGTPGAMISPALRALVRCPACRGALEVEAVAPTEAAAETLRCAACGERFPQVTELTWISGHRWRLPSARSTWTRRCTPTPATRRVSPPLLQAGVRQRRLRASSSSGLAIASSTSAAAAAARDLEPASGAAFIGVDVSPFFAHEARARVDLALADLRQLPFADAAFTKGYALDVLEHLSPAALDAMLAEAARVLGPGGTLFVYSHVRKNAAIAKGLRAINALARGLERVGLIDMTQERLRKSDHLNPLADVPHLEAVVARAGFRIARIRYYTPIVGGFVENILFRMAERLLARRAAGRQGRAAGIIGRPGGRDPRGPHRRQSAPRARWPGADRPAGADVADGDRRAAVRPRPIGPLLRAVGKTTAQNPPLGPEPGRPVALSLQSVACSPLSPVPCSLFLVPCSLFLVPCSLFLVPCSLFPVPCSLFPEPCS